MVVSMLCMICNQLVLALRLLPVSDPNYSLVEAELVKTRVELALELQRDEK